MVEWKTCAKVISWVDLGTTGSEKCVASGGWRAKCRKLRENNIFIYGAQMRVSRRERVCVCVCSSLNKYLYTSCPPSSDENLRARQVCWPRGCNHYRKIVHRRHRFLFSAGSIERFVRARALVYFTLRSRYVFPVWPRRTLLLRAIISSSRPSLSTTKYYWQIIIHGR